MSGWWRDFSIKNGVVHVRTTGARVPISWTHTKDVLTFLSIYAAERLRSLPRRILFRPTGYIYALPKRPRAWYLIWAAAHRAGYAFTTDLSKADISLSFEDQTHTKPSPPPHGLPALNFDCTDISKSHVSAMFKKAFGYDLAVDPDIYTGKMVSKAEENATHDGKIIEGPTKPEPGQVYQKLIDNRNGNVVTDLRCCTIGGKVKLLVLKSRPLEKRFANLNTHCEIAEVTEHFTLEELSKVRDFCELMNLDWGSLDILRNADDGKIYIVDVNKTDMGPPLALPLREKMKAIGLLARAFHAHVESTKTVKPMHSVTQSSKSKPKPEPIALK